jgi:hypothetical protein
MTFQKGQSGNPGGRPSEARAALSALLDEQFPLAKRKKVIKLLVEDATSDDYDRRKEARPLLLAYTFGKPTEYKELSGPDGEPLFKAYEKSDAFNPDDA